LMECRGWIEYSQSRVKKRKERMATLRAYIYGEERDGRPAGASGGVVDAPPPNDFS
jgi:hypothetical protein